MFTQYLLFPIGILLLAIGGDRLVIGSVALSNKLKVIAKAKDDTIEAFCNNQLKIYAQMWHPERDDPFKKKNLELIKHFFNVK